MNCASASRMTGAGYRLTAGGRSGLASLAQRAEAAGGAFTTARSQGRGTVLTWIAPLQQR